MEDHGGKSNDYIENAGYDKYYQVRTLNWNLPSDKQFLEMSFTPTAPVTEGVNATWENQESPHGQIMGTKKVFVRIYPKDYAQDDINVYEMIMKCYFSPNIRFDPSYSADSELQDMHGNGQFSYWRFRLDKATGSQSLYEPNDPEHESDKI